MPVPTSGRMGAFNSQNHQASFPGGEMFRFLKREITNWVLIKLSLQGLGRVGEIPAVRKRAMKVGLSRLGAAIDSIVGSKVFGRRRSRWPGQMESGTGSAVISGATLGIGAGLMYLFDPDRGACRRARLKDKA